MISHSAWRGSTLLNSLRLLVFAVAITSIGSVIPANAQQIPALLEVPEAIAMVQPFLVTHRAALAQERNSLRVSFASQKAECSAVDERDKEKVRMCINLKQKLKTALDLHIEKSEEFNRLLNKVVAESSLSFHHSPRGLIGGMKWNFGTYAMNAPTNLSGEQARRAREESERQFFARLKRAGIPEKDFIDPKQYDFIIGVAESSNGFQDLFKRVLWDNLAKGRATPLLQKEYNLIRGRSFDVLDCHSNGAMLCLAAIANDHIRLTGQGPVRLFGPQITPSAIKEWERLAQKDHFKLEIYYNSGDLVPRISYAAHELLAIKMAPTEEHSILKEVFAGTGLQDLIARDAPSAKIITSDCGDTGAFRYSTNCHIFQWYQNHYPPK
jgi:hypothetical protein